MVATARKLAKSKTVRRRAGRGDRVRHILGESLECFADQGFERVTYDDLIARSKVSRGSFYWYFPSKEALYDAVIDSCVVGWKDRVEAAYEKTKPRDPVAKRIFTAVLADFNANRSQYRLLLRPPPSKNAIAKLAQWNEDASDFIASELAPLVASGKLDAATARILPDVLSAFIDGVCVRLVLEDEGSVSTLSKNIETFLGRFVPEG